MKCPKCQSDNPDTLKFCGECGTQLIPKEGIPVTETLETPKEELTRGTTFAQRYEIIEELGKGGMGKVYRVEDKKIKEEVALKLIKPEIASDKKTIERFRSELKIARKIRHKNVCGMYDLDEEKGTHYITMEYVSGEDLKSSIKRMGPLGAGKAIFISKQICEGLTEAHRLGVVHRDLKPNNIMIDKEGNARIMDFGIARSLKAKGITAEGAIIGTPEYMSPEQVEGKEANKRSDIYSLGVILYEMVTGRVPFEGDTPFTIGVKHKSETPQNPRELNAQIPEDLSRVILKCLEKEKEKRCQSTAEVLSELNNIEKGLPMGDKVIPTKKPATSKEITVTFNVKKLLFPALVVGALVIAFILILQLLPKREVTPLPTDKPTLAIMYFKNNTGDVSLDHLRSAFSDMLITDLMKSRYIDVISADRLLNILKELNLLKAESYTSDDLEKVAALGGATFMLTGGYIKVADAFRVDIVIQDTITMKYFATETVKDTEANFLWMVDDLTKKIKANFKLSEKEIASDSNLVEEIAGDSDFVKSAMIAKGEIKPPKLIKEVPPVYPEEARKKRVEGAVIVQARIDEQGNVEAVKLLRSIPLLDQAAINAVKQWKYEPWLHKNKPTPIIVAITATFKLKAREHETGMSWKNSIAVLPFENLSPDKDQEYFCDGLADELISRLTKIESLRVPARTSSFSFKGKILDIREIGKKLNVETVLEGSIRKAGNKLRITAQLVNVADDYPIWSERYERKLEDIFAIQDEISLAIVDNLKIKLLSGEKEKLVKRYTENLEAYNLYIKGRWFWNKRTLEGYQKAIECFQQAIKIEPNHALAYAGIADSYTLIGDRLFAGIAFLKAKEAAMKALEIDDRLAEAHTSLALIKMYYDWDWQGAEQEFKRAIELNPCYATAHQWYALNLMEMARFDEAVKEIKQAHELDPLSLIINQAVGWVFFYDQLYDQAIEAFQRVMEMDSNFSSPYVLGRVYLQKSMHEKALAEFQKADSKVWIGITYAKMGKKSEALLVLDDLIKQVKRTHVSPYFMAIFYFTLGEHDKGFNWLDLAYEERDSGMRMLKIDLFFNCVRSDPRFKALLKKMGFEE